MTIKSKLLTILSILAINFSAIAFSASIPSNNLAFGDFNGDGAQDVFYADGQKWWVSYSGSTEWEYLNNSEATLDNIAIGDIDGNGISDVFYATMDGFMGEGWYVSYGGTQDWTFLKTSAAMFPNIALADMDGDGKDDVFFTTTSGYAGSGWYVSYGAVNDWTFLKASSAMLPNIRSFRETISTVKEILGLEKMETIAMRKKQPAYLNICVFAYNVAWDYAEAAGLDDPELYAIIKWAACMDGFEGRG